MLGQNTLIFWRIEMSKMAELHYKQQQNQEDDPSIEYNMIYDYIGKWTPRIYKWYNKKYANPKKAKPVYIKAKKVECPF